MLNSLIFLQIQVGDERQRQTAICENVDEILLVGFTYKMNSINSNVYRIEEESKVFFNILDNIRPETQTFTLALQKLLFSLLDFFSTKGTRFA